MDYSNEPEHSELLVVQAQEPFNAEPLSAALVEFQLTPEELVYCRNHGPVRQFSEDDYTLTIKGMVGKEVTLSMRYIKTMFPQTRVVAALQVRFYSVDHESYSQQLARSALETDATRWAL